MDVLAWVFIMFRREVEPRGSNLFTPIVLARSRQVSGFLI